MASPQRRDGRHPAAKAYRALNAPRNREARIRRIGASRRQGDGNERARYRILRNRDRAPDPPPSLMVAGYDRIGPGLTRDYVKCHGRTATNVMTRDVIAVAATTDLAEVAMLLETKWNKRVCRFDHPRPARSRSRPGADDPTPPGTGGARLRAAGNRRALCWKIRDRWTVCWSLGMRAGRRPVRSTTRCRCWRQPRR